MVTERDPGERNRDDHLVGYLRWQHSKGRLVLGDLRAGFSQGLVFGRGSGRGRGRPRRDSHTLGLRSSAENRAIRGAAASLGRGQWLVVVQAGQLRRDARFDEAGNVCSLPEDGLHTGPRLWRVKTHFRVRSRGSGFDGSGKIATSVSSCSIFVSVRDCGCRVAMGDLCSLAGRRPRAPSTGVGLLVDGNSMANSLVLHPRGASSEVSSTAGETGSVGRGRSGRMGLDSSVLSGRRIDSGRHWNERGVVIDRRGSRWRTWAEISQRPRPASIPVSDDSSEAGFERTWRVSPGQLRLDLRQRYDLDWRQHARYRGTRRIRLAGTRSSGLHRWRI